MKNFIFGIVFGIVVATVGFRGIAPLLDNIVASIQRTTIQTIKPDLTKYQ